MVLSFATYEATVLPAIYVLGPVFAQEHLDGASSWAWILSARAVGALGVGVVLLRWRPRRPLVASTAVILLDVPFLACLALGLPLPVVIATTAVSSAGLVAADTVWESTFQARVPTEVLSRVSSYESLGPVRSTRSGSLWSGRSPLCSEPVQCSLPHWPARWPSAARCSSARRSAPCDASSPHRPSPPSRPAQAESPTSAESAIGHHRCRRRNDLPPCSAGRRRRDRSTSAPVAETGSQNVGQAWARRCLSPPVLQVTFDEAQDQRHP